MHPVRVLCLLSICFFLFLHCKKEDDSPVITPINFPEGKGFDNLSDYNFFIGNLADLTHNAPAGVLPYDLNTALFSDYAAKKRYVYVPEGSTLSLIHI